MGNNNTPSQPPKEEPKISVQEFYDSRNYSVNDKIVMERIHKTKKLTSEEWTALLEPKFNEIN